VIRVESIHTFAEKPFFPADDGRLTGYNLKQRVRLLPGTGARDRGWGPSGKRENERAYPGPRMFGEIPRTDSLFVTSRGLELNGIEVSYLNEDLRPPFLVQNVSQSEFDNVKGQRASGVATLVLKDVDGFKIHDCPFAPDTKLRGERTAVLDCTAGLRGDFDMNFLLLAMAIPQLAGAGLAQHPFLYCGEWQGRGKIDQTMYVVRGGKVVWT
jgi:hypothetical protein